ncbi:hypothetical protein EJ110_NYTH23292 [Nymphaea thermarum]|nr:hypothetical protein EJ110_NYTH23292 [Nymphaea thermarum]
MACPWASHLPPAVPRSPSPSHFLFLRRRERSSTIATVWSVSDSLLHQDHHWVTVPIRRDVSRRLPSSPVAVVAASLFIGNISFHRQRPCSKFLIHQIPGLQKRVKGEYFHIRCGAHIINLIVKDDMNDMDDTISKIRDSVKHVRGSPK